MALHGVHLGLGLMTLLSVLLAYLTPGFVGVHADISSANRTLTYGSGVLIGWTEYPGNVGEDAVYLSQIEETYNFDTPERGGQAAAACIGIIAAVLLVVAVVKGTKAGILGAAGLVVASAVVTLAIQPFADINDRFLELCEAVPCEKTLLQVKLDVGGDVSLFYRYWWSAAFALLSAVFAVILGVIVLRSSAHNSAQALPEY